MHLAPDTQCMLNKSTCLYSLCKKAELDRPLSPLTRMHTASIHSATLTHFFTIHRADFNARLQCLIRFPYLCFFFLLGRRFRH
jgi:hypothetical protein